MPEPLAIAPSPNVAASGPGLPVGTATIPIDESAETGGETGAENFASLLLAKMVAALPTAQNATLAVDTVSSMPRDEPLETTPSTDIIAMLAPLLPGIVPATPDVELDPAVEADALTDTATTDPALGLPGNHRAAITSIPMGDVNSTPAAMSVASSLVSTTLPRDEPVTEVPSRQTAARSPVTTSLVAASEAQSPAIIASVPDAMPQATAAETPAGTAVSFEAVLADMGVAPALPDNSVTAPAMQGIAHAKPLEFAATRGAHEIAVPVGQSGWDTAIGERVTWMVARQETRAELVLNPPQLGRIEVSLSMNGDQTSAVFVSANPAVREALENAVPRLREILQDAGISLGQTQVGSESFRQSADRGENNDNRHQRHTHRSSDEQSSTGFVAGTPTQWIRRGAGLVDTFA